MQAVWPGLARAVQGGCTREAGSAVAADRHDGRWPASPLQRAHPGEGLEQSAFHSCITAPHKLLTLPEVT